MATFELLISATTLGLVWFGATKQLLSEGKSKKESLSTGFFSGLIVMLLVMFALSFITDDSPSSTAPEEAAQAADEPKRAEPEAPADEVAKPAEPEKTLLISRELFIRHLNATLKERGSLYRALDDKITEGDVYNTFNSQIGDYSMVTVLLSKTTGGIISVTMIGMGDGGSASGADVMLSAAAALSAASTRTTPDDLLPRIVRLTKGEKFDAGDVIFSAKKMDGLGLWFFAEPK